jgi:hypothetical protein
MPTDDPQPRPWHEVLEVPPDADADAVKRAFRRLAVVHHPDRAGDGGARFREVSAAYAAWSALHPPPPGASPPQDAATLDAIFRAVGGQPSPPPAPSWAIAPWRVAIGVLILLFGLWRVWMALP